MSVTPDFIGQVYKDTNTGNIWRANSTTPGDWTLEVQNMLVKWTPTSESLGNQIGFVSWSDLVGNTSLTFEGTTSLGGWELDEFLTCASIQFPNLLTIDPGGSQNGYLSIGNAVSLVTLSAPLLQSIKGALYLSGCSSLPSISFPSLVSIGSYFQANGCTSIISLSIPSLVSVGGNFQANGNTSLTSVDLSAFLPSNSTDVQIQGAALTDVSVNHVLARCVANPAYVSGSVVLDGGTSSAPSGQGILDKATLIGRGVAVATN